MGGCTEGWPRTSSRRCHPHHAMSQRLTWLGTLLPGCGCVQKGAAALPELATVTSSSGRSEQPSASDAVKLSACRGLADSIALLLTNVAAAKSVSLLTKAPSRHCGAPVSALMAWFSCE
jgi:hypothetical protein